MGNVTDGGVIVIRGGAISKDELEKAVKAGTCKIDTRDKLYDVSVQVSLKAGKLTDKKLMDELCKPLPNPMISYVYFKHILNAGGVIKYNAIKDNAYHGLLSNLTIDEMVRIFKAN